MMPFKIYFDAEFEREVKRLEKRFPQIREDIRDLLNDLQEGALGGDRISGVNIVVYKVRLKNRSAQRGKSGGFRAIYAVVGGDTLVFFHIYSKTDKTDIGLAEIRRRLRHLL